MENAVLPRGVHFWCQILEVFVQENFSNFWESLRFLKKMLLKFFSNSIPRPVRLEKMWQPNFAVLFWPIILISDQKNFFWKSLKFSQFSQDIQYFWNLRFLKKYFWFDTDKVPIQKENFQGFLIFKNFAYNMIFQNFIFLNQKKNSFEQILREFGTKSVSP